MPDGRELRMFRGIEKGIYHEIRHQGAVPKRIIRPQGPPMGDGTVDSGPEEDSHVFRSFLRDGSLFEVAVG
jgi:hypothetical protein